MSCPKHDPRGERPRTSFIVNGETVEDVCLDCANERVKGYKYMPEATIEELRQHITDVDARIARVTRAKASLKRLTDEYETARENKKQAENELDLSIADLDNYRQIGLPLGTGTISNEAAAIASVGSSTTFGALVTTDSYKIGDRVAHAKKGGAFAICDIIDSRHVGVLRPDELNDPKAKQLKVNISNLRLLAEGEPDPPTTIADAKKKKKKAKARVRKALNDDGGDGPPNKKSRRPKAASQPTNAVAAAA